MAPRGPSKFVCHAKYLTFLALGELHPRGVVELPPMRLKLISYPSILDYLPPQDYRVLLSPPPSSSSYATLPIVMMRNARISSALTRSPALERDYWKSSLLRFF